MTILSDAMNVVKAINLKKQPKEVYGIINDVLALTPSFSSICFDFVPREENILVDSFAKKL